MSKITIDRAVVEQALDALSFLVATHTRSPGTVARDALRAALDQPHDHAEQHLGMVPPGWKLVPVEPTDDMLYDIQEYSHVLPPRGRRIWAHMLAAAPQPPAVEQEPVAWQCRMRADWGRSNEWWPWQECSQEKAEDYKRVPYLNNWQYESRPLYTHPQPRQPLTDADLCTVFPVIATYTEANKALYKSIARAIEAAHGIGGEA